MYQLLRLLTVCLLTTTCSSLFSQTFNPGSFHKVIVSPYIEATFIEGDQEKVVIDNAVVDLDKLNVETKNGTLRIYLDGAKEIPRNPRSTGIDNQLYPKTAISATVYFKNIDELSLRGEEQFSCLGKLSVDNFTVKLYGESALTLAEVQINNLRTIIYGESSIEIQSGMVNKQSYTCYGEGRVNTSGISGNLAKLTAYGEADFRMNVTERIRITSFGEARLRYKGNPQIDTGIRIGEVDIARLN